MVEMIHVASESLESVGYDPIASELFVVFKRGARYRLTGVPQHVFDDLLQSASKGSYFNKIIKPAYPAFKD